MARVFLADETSLGRRVVVKVLDPELTVGLSAERFAREVKLLAALQHPNIVPIISASVAGGLPYYTMPFVDGKSLKDLLAEKGRVEIPTALGFLRDVARALAYAHESGVVHRDIKPANVLVSHGAAVVADFGIAKAVRVAESSKDPTLTATGMSLGTPAYMAPEQAAGDPNTDHRADIYAWGVLGYELLTGHVPFHDRPPHGLLVAQMTETPPSVTVARKDTPTGLAALIARCLNKNPADRPQSAAEILALLEDSRTSSFLGSWESRPRKLVAGLLGLAIIGTAFGAVSWRSHHSPPSAIHTPMVAVLPFKNLGAAQDEYFADGMTEELTSRLASLHGLGVISRTSANRYKQGDKSLKQIAKELGVDYVLEGSVRWERASNGKGRVRVTPQLIEVSDDRHLWADRYDADLTDVFQVQTSIAERVARALDIAFGASERRTLAARPTDNLEAYDYYLRGQALRMRNVWPHQPSYYIDAVKMLEHAVALDSGFALAWASLAEVRGRQYAFSFDVTKANAERFKFATDKAVALAPDLPEAHEALGFYHTVYGDPDGALREYTLAQRGHPNDPGILGALAFGQAQKGRWTESWANMRRAAELDPKSVYPAISVAGLGMILREFSEAQRAADKALALEPDAPTPYLLEAEIRLDRAGDTAGVRRVFDRALEKVGAEALARAVARRPRLLPWSGPLMPMLERLTPESLGRDTATYLWFKAWWYYYVRHDARRAAAFADSALPRYEDLVRSHPTNYGYRHYLSCVYAFLGRSGDAVREARKAVELLPITKDAWGGPVELTNLARIYAITGHQDAAIDELEKLLSIPSDVSVGFLRVDPPWDPLRSNPRFQRLIAAKP